jgi:hypothetical protein
VVESAGRIVPPAMPVLSCHSAWVLPPGRAKPWPGSSRQPFAKSGCTIPDHWSLSATNARALYYQCKSFVLLLQRASHNLDCRIRRGSRIDRQPIRRRSSTNGNGPHEFPMLAVFVATHH